MKIIPCPKCGRMPKIIEGVRGKNSIRRRFIGCPNYCSVIKTNKYNKNWRECFLTYIGDGDDNTIYME